MISPAKKNTGGFWRTAALLALSAVPVVAGAARLRELAIGAAITAGNARFFAAPLPVVVHIVAATLFSVLGAFQFVPRLRAGKAGWHRRAGWLVTVSGVVVGVTGLWMTQFYPRPEGDGDLVQAFRLVFGSAMLASTALSLVSIARRDFARHGAWALRAYAIGMGAGTQVFTHLPYVLLDERPGELARAIAMGAGWIINLAVAEWLVRRAPRAPRAARPERGAPAGVTVASQRA